MSKNVTVETPAPAEKGVSRWAQAVDGIARMKQAAADSLAHVRARARSLSLQAVLGDAGARAELDRLNTQATDLDRSLQELAAAEGEAQEELAAAQAAEAAEAERIRREGCAAIAAAAVEAAEAVDAAMKALVAAADVFKDHVRELWQESKHAPLGNSQLFGDVYFTPVARSYGLNRHLALPPAFTHQHQGTMADAARNELAQWLKKEE